jgi:hypothetical protein
MKDLFENKLTEKQIAQIYYINDIIVHELIFDALNDLEEKIKKHKVSWSKSDLVHKVTRLASDNELVEIFEITPQEINKVICEQYVSEIEELFLISNS